MRPPRAMIMLKSGLFVLAFWLVVMFPAVISHSRLHKNFTDSVPIGLYREAPEGQYAAFCLALPVVIEAARAGLDLESGHCPGGVMPLLKPVLVATSEFPVTLSVQGVMWHDWTDPYTKPKPYSRTGKPLRHYPFGVYTSGLWAVSSYNPNSFDSRYFGPVEPSSVLYHLKPFWIF